MLGTKTILAVYVTEAIIGLSIAVASLLFYAAFWESLEEMADRSPDTR